MLCLTEWESVCLSAWQRTREASSVLSRWLVWRPKRWGRTKPVRMKIWLSPPYLLFYRDWNQPGLKQCAAALEWAAAAREWCLSRGCWMQQHSRANGTKYIKVFGGCFILTNVWTWYPPWLKYTPHWLQSMWRPFNLYCPVVRGRHCDSPNPLWDFVHIHVRVWHYLQKSKTAFILLFMAAGLNLKYVSECDVRVRMQPTDVIIIQMFSKWGPYMCKIKPH